MDELTPEQRALVERTERDLRSWSDGGIIGDIRRSIEDETRAMAQQLVRRCVADCGFDVAEQDRAAESVEVVNADGASITFTYEVDERVSAYIRAIQQGDVERAIMLRAAREG